MKPALVLLCLAVPGLVAGEERGIAQDLQRSLEMPAHRSLLDKIMDPETTLAPFETDGCSGGMSSSWRMVADVFPDFARAQGRQPPWEDCCITHDRAYHDAGGAMDPDASFEARLTADEALRRCVAEPPADQVSALADRFEAPPERIRLAYELVADSMFNAVRFGGAPCSGLPWRWGYGYPGCVPGF